ncbi:MAG: F-box protein [Holosporales bacterium]
MGISHITCTLALVSLLGSSLSALKATELTGFKDLPEDALLGIMRFLPDRDIGAMAMTSRAPCGVSHGALFLMIAEMTLNRGGKENTQRLQSLPKSRVQDVLRQIAENECYVVVPMNSDLCTMMPATLKLADLEDWHQNLAIAMPLYEAAFGQDFPEAHVDLALQHLLAVLDTRIYVQRNNVNESFARFAAKQSKNLSQSLHNQRQVRPFINLLHGNVDGTLLAAQAHTIVLSDAELAQPETKQKFEQLLASQTVDLSHHVMLSVGNNPQLLQAGALFLRGDSLPTQVRYLTVTNPAANVTGIGVGFLEKPFLASNNDLLTKLRITGFQSVTWIGSYFLYYCHGLTRVDLSGLPNVKRITPPFLTNCTALTPETQQHIRAFCIEHGLEWKIAL